MKLANYNRGIDEQVLIPNQNIEVPDRLLLNKIIHGYYVDTTHQYFDYTKYKPKFNLDFKTIFYDLYFDN